MKRAEQITLVLLLIELPIFTIWAGKRIHAGKILVRFGSDRGLHESDVVELALVGPLWLILLARLRRLR